MKAGEKVIHILTGEEVLILEDLGKERKIIRLNNYAEISVYNFELAYETCNTSNDGNIQQI